MTDFNIVSVGAVILGNLNNTVAAGQNRGSHRSGIVNAPVNSVMFQNRVIPLSER